MIDKRKIFLAPVSSSSLYKNYHETVINGIKTELFLKYLNSIQYNNIIGKKKFVRLWGIKDVKKTAFNRSEIGDVILFYHKGQIVGKADILHKDINKPLSELIWGFDLAKQEYWANLLFLDNYLELNIDFKVLIELAFYSPKASVRGFNIYSSIGTDAILTKYKSIDIFLKENSK